MKRFVVFSNPDGDPKCVNVLYYAPVELERWLRDSIERHVKDVAFETFEAGSVVDWLPSFPLRHRFLLAIIQKPNREGVSFLQELASSQQYQSAVKLALATGENHGHPEGFRQTGRPVAVRDSHRGEPARQTA